MSSKNTKIKKESIKKDKKISSVIEIKEKDNRIVFLLIIVIAILLSLLVYFAFFNKCKDNCEKCKDSTIEIEVDPSYQLTNYLGYKFKMPLEWDFVADSNGFNIANMEETIFITFDYLEEDYEIFKSNEYQINYLEKVQTSDNIKIDSSKEIENYFIYEGSYNNYKYLIVAFGNENRTIFVKTQFIDKVTFDNLKDKVIEFAISSLEKSEE